MLAQDNQDIRQAEIMDQRSRMISAEMKGREEGREEGRVEGKVEGRKEVAKSLLTRGMSVDDVAEVAGMNREQVAEMQTQVQASQGNLIGNDPEVIKMLAHDNQDIRQAYTLLEVISQDKTKRMAYEARQAELMDQRSRMISAEMKGREEGRKEVVKSLLTRGMSVDDVAEVAGMSRVQVAEMQSEI